MIAFNVDRCLADEGANAAWIWGDGTAPIISLCRVLAGWATFVAGSGGPRYLADFKVDQRSS